MGILNNNEYVGILAGDGIGGLLNSFSIAALLKTKNKQPLVYVAARKEVFDGIKYLMSDNFYISHIDEDAEKFAKDETLINKHSLDFLKELYFNWPDLVFSHKRAFNFKKYGLDPNTIKTHRLLTHKYKPEKIVYIGLNSTTPGYTYLPLNELLIELSSRLPNHIIYCPVIDEWNGIKLKERDFENLPENVQIDRNPDIKDSFDVLFKSEFCICTDNAVSHLSYHLGQPRALLDPQMGKPNFLIRWREVSYYDSLPIESIKPEELADVVQKCILLPQLNMVDKNWVYSNPSLGIDEWKYFLGFKY